MMTWHNMEKGRLLPYTISQSLTLPFPAALLCSALLCVCFSYDLEMVMLIVICYSIIFRQ